MRCRKQTRKIRVHWLAIVIPVALSVGACTTARVNQFNSFAKAGGRLHGGRRPIPRGGRRRRDQYGHHGIAQGPRRHSRGATRATDY